jgi:hypothetical protein
MRASRTLPPGYVLAGTLRLAGNPRLVRTLWLLAAPCLLASIMGAGLLAALVRPLEVTVGPDEFDPVLFLGTLVVGLAVALVGTLVLHEAAHAAVLWVITRARPVFGFKGWYLYVDAPGWFLTRGQMLATLVAPQVLLPLLVLPVIAYGPVAVALFGVAALTVNGVGGLADAYATVVVLRIRGPVLFGDDPDGRPGESGSWYLPARAA